MASYHCTVKAGASGSAGAHDEYIERTGKYEKKKGDDLEAVESGNLPDWAEDSAHFWRESDQRERINACGYREYEVALPRELTPDQRLELVREFVRQELGDRHAYSFAIHNPRAAIEGGEQPHAHIMFSERLHDGIERATPAQYFKRADSKRPERGGCAKVGGARKSSVDRKAELVALRERWGTLQNRHLERAGSGARVDHRSLKDRGIDRVSDGHIGPRGFATAKKGRVSQQARDWDVGRVLREEVSREPAIERRLAADQAELAALIELEHLAQLQAVERARQAQAEKEKAQRDQAQAAVVDRNKPEAAAEEIVGLWRQLVAREQKGYVGELVEAAGKALKGVEDQLKAHLQTKPKLLGRKGWEDEKQVLEDQRHSRAMRLDELKDSRFPRLDEDQRMVQAEAERRATAQQPKLADAQAGAAAILQARAQSQKVERAQAGAHQLPRERGRDGSSR